MRFKLRRGVSLILAVVLAFTGSMFGNMPAFGVPGVVRAASDTTVTAGKEVSATLSKGDTWTLYFTPDSAGSYTLSIKPSATSSSATTDSPKVKITSGSSASAGSGANYKIEVKDGAASDFSAGRNYLTLTLSAGIKYRFILTLTEITGTGSSSSGSSSGSSSSSSSSSSSGSSSSASETGTIVEVDGNTYYVLSDGTLMEYTTTTTKSSSKKDDDDDDDDKKNKNKETFNSSGDIMTAGSGKSKADYAWTSSSTARYETSEISSGGTEAVVPARVKIKSKTYTVTAVATNAFSGFDKLKKVTIGANVKTLKPGSLGNAKSLKTLKIASPHLTKSSVKGCLKNSAVTTVYVPISKYTAYKKIFTKSNTGSKNGVIVKSYGSKKPSSSTKKSSSSSGSSSSSSSSSTSSRPSSGTYIKNTSSKIFHKPSCSTLEKISDSNKEEFTGERQVLIDEGYRACARCHP